MDKGYRNQRTAILISKPAHRNCVVHDLTPGRLFVDGLIRKFFVFVLLYHIMCYNITLANSLSYYELNRGLRYGI